MERFTTLCSFISSEMNPSSILTERIIAEISKSITVFKPSKSLYQLSVDDVDDSAVGNRSTDVDVVISGGGLKGYYVCGCIAVLQHQFNAHKINIARVSGASAGAWSAMFICCGLSTTLWIESYHRLTENPNKTIHEVYVEDLVRYVVVILLLICTSGRWLRKLSQKMHTNSATTACTSVLPYSPLGE